MPNSEELSVTHTPLQISETALPPLQTPKKTLTPHVLEPTLSPEVQDKFNKAGIDVRDMQNATLDNRGLHIQIDNQEKVSVKIEDLEKFVSVGFKSEDISFGEDNFLPVFDPKTGDTSVYTFNKIGKIWDLIEILPLPDPLDAQSCTFRHITSGSLNEMVKRMNILFPKDAICNGWVYPGNDRGYIVPNGKSVEWLQPIVFSMSADFMGLNRKFDLMCLPVLNPDDSITCVNFCIPNVGTAPTASAIRKVLKSSNGMGVGIKVPANLSDIIGNMGEDNTYAIGARIQYLFDPVEMKSILSSGSVNKLSNKINLAVI